MSPQQQQTLGLLVRDGPFRARAPRSQLDMALAAAALEKPLALFFIGHGLLQLLAERDTRTARFPAGLAAWKSLPELTRVSAFACAEDMALLPHRHTALLLDVDVVSRQEMAKLWTACHKVMVL
jgi:sulfur relay protein TusC/DsrF